MPNDAISRLHSVSNKTKKKVRNREFPLENESGRLEIEVQKKKIPKLIFDFEFSRENR